MRRSTISLCLAGAIVSLTSLAAAQTPTPSAKATAYGQWFVKLIGDHMNKDFCPPPGTTYSMAATAIRDYGVAHHFKDNLTDAEFLSLLAEIYPCPKPKALTAAEAAALGAKPLGSVSGRYTVPAVGVYATIDMGATMQTLDELRTPSSPAQLKRIETIEENPSHYLPLVLMQVGMTEFRNGNLDKAMFWYHAGLLRVILDVRLCSDKSVGNVPSRVLSQTAPELLKAAMTSEKVADVIRRAVAWDAATPYDYDHRWIANSGILATQSALNPALAPSSIIIPADQRAAVMRTNRDAYPNVVSGIAKQMASLAPVTSPTK